MLISRRQFLVVATIALTPISLPASAQDQSALKMWQDGDAGEKLALSGRVISATGKPIANARIQMRQADGNTQYTEQYSGVVFTDAKGRFKVLTVVPGQYASAKHIHIFVYAEGHVAINTDILFKGDPNVDLGTGGGLEVLLEQLTQGEKTSSVGAVEIRMTPI